MLRSYRDIVAALVGVVLLLAGVVFGLGQQAAYEQEAQRRGADYAARAANKVKQACLGKAAPQKAECTKIEASEYKLEIRNNQREQDDLAAQQTSAVWTSVMGIAALIGMALSAIGLALVWTTFKETKRTNLIAMRENARNTRRAMQASDDTSIALKIAGHNAQAAAEHVEVAKENADRQLRAYIGVSDIKPIDEIENKLYVIRLFFKNFGQTPARIWSVQIASYLGTFPDNDPRISGPAIESYIHFVKMLNPQADAPIMAVAVSDEEHDAFRNATGDQALYFYGRIDYADVFGRMHWVEFCHRVTWSTRNLIAEASICPAGNESD